jgi:hypothetical protein
LYLYYEVALAFIEEEIDVDKKVLFNEVKDRLIDGKNIL